MQVYINILEDVEDIRKMEMQYDSLSGIELKLYQKMTGKINQLAQSTHPDLCYVGLDMSEKSNSATISDLR